MGIMSLLFLLVVSILFGVLVGLPSSYKGVLPGILVAALMTTMSMILTRVAFLLSAVAQPGWILSQLLLAAIVFSGVILYRRRFVEFGISEALGVIVSIIVGILVGTTLFTEAWIISGLFLVTMLGLSGLERERPRSEVYTLSMELESAETLDDLNSLLRGFSLHVVDKSLIRSRETICFTVIYRSTPLIQHLFFNKVAGLEGVSQIKVC
jgi:uncharacterized membrane protein YhiD involved in acid resistance